MQAKTRNRLLLAIVIFAPALLFLGFFIFMSADRIPLPPLPAQNGYSDLVKAGAMASESTNELDKMDQQELRAIVAQNSAALTLARSALSNQCAVPMQFSQDYINKHLDDLSGLKRMGVAFAAEGRLAEMENRPNDAVHSFLDVIRMGDASSRGGALIDELVGIALYQIGGAHLQKIIPQLDTQTSREAASELESLDSQRQTWDDVMQQEQGWSQRTFTGFGYELARIEERRSLAVAFQRSEKKYAASEQKQRQLIIDLAAHAYTLDKGKPPTSASDLIPDYLKAVPVDPISGAKMGLSGP
ncbi:MAG TPA: hypothetical protein VGN23_16065 [Verrucomicrobiae bacterium]|jgi:hypothetical protein